MAVSYKIGMDVKLKNFRQGFMLTWLFISIGIVLYILCMFLGHLTPQGGYFYFFLNNIGILLMFTAFLMSYSGVYRITTAPEGAQSLTRGAIRETMKRGLIILAISFTTVILVTLVVLLQVGVSAVSNIPYAGPFIMALLTIPLFLVNFICFIIAIFVFALSPPMVAEAKSLKDIFIEIRISIVERWANVLLYVFISLAVLAVSVYLIHYIVKYSIGVTIGLQWTLNSVYPGFMRGLSLNSYFSDIAGKIVPTLQMGTEDFSGPYGQAITYIVSMSYLALFSFLISFPLTVYFNASSVFFGRVRVDTLDK